MFMNALAALGLLLCLLWLVHGWLPAARQQAINHRLRRLRLWLQQLPGEFSARRGGRQARAEAQAAIERARRDAAAERGQVHDLERFRRRREEEREADRRKH